MSLFRTSDYKVKNQRVLSKKIKIPFNCFLILDMVNDDLLILLKEAGCYSVHLSVDSVSDYVREKILNRKMKKINIEEILKKIKKYKINTWVNYMLAAPCSTLQDDMRTIYMSKKAKVTYSQYSTTVPINKTTLYDYCIKNKIIKSDYKGDMSKAKKKSE